jgi:hypothetical protein
MTYDHLSPCVADAVASGVARAGAGGPGGGWAGQPRPPSLGSTGHLHPLPPRPPWTGSGTGRSDSGHGQNSSRPTDQQTEGRREGKDIYLGLNKLNCWVVKVSFPHDTPFSVFFLIKFFYT